MPRSLVMIMAGGKGSRLGPLTCHRAKPATPFGGRYRIIDFVLSNFVNSGYQRIYVLTQYMASSLIRHLNRTWHISGYDAFIQISPAQMRHGEHWYRGTADSIYQNLNLIRDDLAEHVAVFGGDHIYKCAVDQMETFHMDVGADLTIAAFPVPKEEAHHFGVMQVDDSGRVVGFEEKPANPKTIPGQPDTCLISMGNYFFKAAVLEEALEADACDPDSKHDFGKNVIPRLLREGAHIQAYDFRDNHVPGDPPDLEPYWRDVGTIDSYFRASMELRHPLPLLNMYNRKWRVRTAQRHHPPARFMPGHRGKQVDLNDCMVCEGSVVEGARLHHSLISYDTVIRSGAELDQTLLMNGCHVGESVKLKNVLADKNCMFGAGVTMGYDLEADRRRFPFITEQGIIVLPKGTFVPAEGPIEFPGDLADLIFNDSSTKGPIDTVEVRPVAASHSRYSGRSSGPGAVHRPEF